MIILQLCICLYNVELHFNVFLLGLRDVSTFTLIIEEYNITTLFIFRKYTQQDGEEYAFPFGLCSVFDYE